MKAGWKLYGTTIVCASVVVCASGGPANAGTHSVARQWNEENLEAIRVDFARPTIHARNLYHACVAMYDAWAVFEEAPYVADQIIHHERQDVIFFNRQAAREEAMSYAAYRVLHARYSKSPGAAQTLANLDARMATLGYDPAFTSTIGSSWAAVGNRVAISVLFDGINDGSNESGGFANLYYTPFNDPIVPELPGNPDIVDPNRWQPIALDFFVDQGGNVILGGYPEFLSPEWGIVTPFCLDPSDLTIYPHADPNYDWWVWHDPGPPPFHGGVGDAYYKTGFEMVSIWSSHLDPGDLVMWDVSPAGIGNSPLAEVSEWASYYDIANGNDWGTGYATNPVTGMPYASQSVPRGDYTRVLAEFWADGPESETPPGHWFVIMNYVFDQPGFEKRLGGNGPIMDELEYDIKAYTSLAGAMHDTAIASWSVKGYYDYIRPISAIRYMCDQGQCSDMMGPSYDPDGINLQPGLIEVVTAETTAMGERHEHLAGEEGKIALYAWRGPDYINDPLVDTAGVGWILAEEWWPYQRPSFVTPPFAGYVSGHSTYSRAAAWLMTYLTGSQYFPGGLGEFVCPQDEFLVFEDGPSVTVTLQWASYFDASDQCSLSRIWGGIHPPADDLPGRHIGEETGPDAWNHAVRYFDGRVSCPADLDADRMISVTDLLALLAAWGGADDAFDVDGDGLVGVVDLLDLFAAWGTCPQV